MNAILSIYAKKNDFRLNYFFTFANIWYKPQKNNNQNECIRTERTGGVET